MIFDIKKFALHDGPGIRTTIFFSGCPLNCRWCHNPECKTDQVTKFSGLTEDALFYLVMKEIGKDRIFYEESGGGVTFSGGEPLLQADFLTRLLESCRKSGIHTAVDTCGHAGFDVFEQLLPLTGLFLYDLKLMDEQAHLNYTGVSNRLILNNLKRLALMQADIRIRIPLIPGITDTEANLTAIAECLTGLSAIRYIDLLPFNIYGKSKYRKLKRETDFGPLPAQSEEELKKISALFRNAGFNAVLY